MSETTTWLLEFHDWGEGDEDNTDEDFKFKRQAFSAYYATTAPGLPMLHLGSCVECSTEVVERLNTLEARAAALDDARAALVETCRGCAEGLPRLVPEGLVDYKYHDLGETPRREVTDALGYDPEDYERLARYLICDLSDTQAAALAKLGERDAG